MSKRTMRHGFFLFAMLLTSCAAKPTTSCFIDVPVYDSHGNRLLYKVSRVFVEDGKRTVDLLGRNIDGVSITTRGSRIVWTSSKSLPTTVRFKVTFTHSQEEPITQEVYAASCQSRWSIVSKGLDGGADSAGVSIRGRLSGCRFSSDWWIRAMPMFGGQVHRVGEEGYVQDDGSFDFAFTAGTGIRHILVIGNGKEPVKTLAATIVVGGLPVNLGVIDLTGFCGANQ